MTNLSADNIDMLAMALSPPFVYGLKPVKEGDGGLGRETMTNEVLIAIDAPQEKLVIGDLIELFWTSSVRADAYKFIRTQADVDMQRHLLTIPAGLLGSQRYPSVFYRFTRGVSQNQNDSPSLNILVLHTQPGGPDRDTGTVGHSELHQTLEGVTDAIDLERAKQGVWVRIHPYPNLRVNDLITLFWANQTIEHLVTQDQAQRPENNPIRMFVSSEKIQAAGSYIQLKVDFQPVDEVGNRPDINGLRSTPTLIDVDIDNSKLDEPYVVQADYETNEILYKDLKGADVEVEVSTNRSDFKPGDTVLVQWQGKTADGTLVIPEIEPKTVTRPGETLGYSVPNRSVESIIRGAAKVSYRVTTSAGKTLLSKTTTVTINGALNPLQAPSIDLANGAYLPPNLTKVVARCPYYIDRALNDTIDFVMLATAPGGAAVRYQDWTIVTKNSNEPILFTILEKDLKQFEGVRLTIWYTVTNRAGVRQSELLHLTGEAPSEQLPAPELVGAPNGVYDPDLNEGDPVLEIPLRLTQSGDVVQWAVVGATAAGSAKGNFTLNAGSEGRPARISFDRRCIDLNRDREVRAYFNITRGTAHFYSMVLLVRIGRALPTLEAPTVVEASQDVLDPNRYQSGFTVRVNTQALKPDDSIELTIAGRPGEGSVVPARQTVNGQTFVTFNIDAAVTGANQGTVATIIYKVIRLGQETPSIPLDLTISALRQESMPQPLIEGTSDGVLEIGRLQDATKVLCEKWPFQRFGLPVWLSYVETRTDGTSRTREQLVGVAHDQGAGLSYTTEVQWLRECQADSKLAIVLKVGLFKEATVSDAVECQARVYTVRAGLDVLSTFTGFDWDQWTMPHTAYRSQISLLAGEHFVESIRYSNGYHYLWLQKVFQDIKIGEQYLFSFDYRVAVNSTFYIIQNGTHIQTITIPGGSGWQSRNVSFYAGTTQTASPMTVQFYVGGSGNVVQIDNIRLREIARS